jgi:hypothetical protein
MSITVIGIGISQRNSVSSSFMCAHAFDGDNSSDVTLLYILIDVLTRVWLLAIL